MKNSNGNQAIGELIDMYEGQIGQSEHQSRALIGEIRRLAKVQALEIQQAQEGNPSLSDRIVKNLKNSMQNLTK
jgi:hypothetical protein